MKIQQFVRHRDATLIQPQRVKFVIPAFTLAASAWAGASVILADYLVSNDYYFTFKLPIRSFGSAFVPAISYIENAVTYRFKFWDDADAVLYYPVYAGDVIGPNARLEIWSLNTADAPTLAAAKSLDTSVLAFQTNACTSCCSNPSVSQVLTLEASVYHSPYSYCNPFCVPILI